MVVMVVKRYALRETERRRYTGGTQGQNRAVHSTQGGCDTPQTSVLRMLEKRKFEFNFHFKHFSRSSI